MSSSLHRFESALLKFQLIERIDSTCLPASTVSSLPNCERKTETCDLVFEIWLNDLNLKKAIVCDLIVCVSFSNKLHPVNYLEIEQINKIPLKMMMEKKREDDVNVIENTEEEPNFSDPEDFFDDITDDGKCTTESYT